MKRTAILCLMLTCPALAGCGFNPVDWLAIIGGTSAGSIAIIHRTPLDAAYSLASGRDCSVVRLDQGETYCKPKEFPPERPPYCTRSLGTVDCWLDPAALPDHPAEVADGPRGLTPAQEADRTHRWGL